jgi:hypothetical protein
MGLPPLSLSYIVHSCDHRPTDSLTLLDTLTQESAVAISDRNVNFRASDATLKELADIQALFHPFLPDRSTTLRWIVRKFWELLFTDTNFTEVLRDWQVFSGNKSQRTATQLNLVFHEHKPSFFPKISRHTEVA